MKRRSRRMTVRDYLRKPRHKPVKCLCCIDVAVRDAIAEFARGRRKVKPLASWAGFWRDFLKPVLGAQAGYNAFYSHVRNHVNGGV